MNIKTFICCIYICLCLGIFKTHGQTIQYGTIPTINLNVGLKNQWKLNFKWESRELLSKHENSEQTFSGFDYLLSDVSLIASRKVGLSNAIAGGYLIRIKDEEVIHRLVQQFTLVKKYNTFRL